MRKQETKLSIFKEVKVLFSGWGIVLRLLLLFLLCAGYLYITSGNFKIAIVLGTVGACWLFFSFVVRNKRLRVYQQKLDDLLNYAMNVKFHLSTGRNVLYSLTESKETASILIKQDIEKTINVMREKGKLETIHFEKYDFPAFDIFHQILGIFYKKGGKIEDYDFNNAIGAMSYEVTKRDELYRGKRSFALQVYLLMGIVFLMPLLLNTVTHDLYQIFLSVPASSVIVSIFFTSILLALDRLQKTLSDISVRL